MPAETLQDFSSTTCHADTPSPSVGFYTLRTELLSSKNAQEKYHQLQAHLVPLAPRDSTSPARMAVRQVKIKTGSVVRLSKELGMYAEEQRAESAKVAGMRADNADSHDIQHAVRGSLSPIPVSPVHACIRRLSVGWFSSFVVVSRPRQ